MCKYCIPDNKPSEHDGVMLSDWYCANDNYHGINSCKDCKELLFLTPESILLRRSPDPSKRWYTYYCVNCKEVNVCEKIIKHRK